MGYLQSLNQNSTQVIESDSSENKLKFKTSDFFINGLFDWRLKKLTISPAYSLRYLNQKLEQSPLFLGSNNFIFEPLLSILYKADRTSVIGFRSGIKQNSQGIQNLFSNPVFVNNRIFRTNIPEVTLQKIQYYKLSFLKNDLFRQLILNLEGSYSKQKGNFFNNTNINENSTLITSFFLPENTENIDFYFNFSKLIPLIKTNIKITSNYSIFNFKNIVNNSDLIPVKSSFLKNTLFFKTAFNSLFNFENETNFIIQENKGQRSFLNKSLQNQTKILMKASKQLFGSISYHFFVPNLNNNNNFNSFLDLQIFFRPKDKNWKVDISGVNLMNEKFFLERNVDEISTNISRVSLLNRYYSLNFSYSF